MPPSQPTMPSVAPGEPPVPLDAVHPQEAAPAAPASSFEALPPVNRSAPEVVDRPYAPAAPSPAGSPRRRRRRRSIRRPRRRSSRSRAKFPRRPRRPSRHRHSSARRAVDRSPRARSADTACAGHAARAGSDRAHRATEDRADTCDREHRRARNPAISATAARCTIAPQDRARDRTERRRTGRAADGRAQESRLRVEAAPVPRRSTCAIRARRGRARRAADRARNAAIGRARQDAGASVTPARTDVPGAQGPRLRFGAPDPGDEIFKPRGELHPQPMRARRRASISKRPASARARSPATAPRTADSFRRSRHRRRSIASRSSPTRSTRRRSPTVATRTQRWDFLPFPRSSSAPSATADAAGNARNCQRVESRGFVQRLRNRLRTTGRSGLRRATSTKPARSNIAFAAEPHEVVDAAPRLVDRIALRPASHPAPRPCRSRPSAAPPHTPRCARLGVDEETDDRPHRLRRRPVSSPASARASRSRRAARARSSRSAGRRVTDEARHDAAIDECAAARACSYSEYGTPAGIRCLPERR